MADNTASNVMVRSQAALGLPANFSLINWDGFDTLNTKPQRTGIGDQEMYWCDNFMPLGRNNLKTLFGQGATLYSTSSSSQTIIFYSFGNIGSTQAQQHSGTPLAFVFLSDGSAVQVNTTNGSTATICSASTFTTTTIATAQWGNQFLIIAADQTNGYFIWDGSNFYQPGSLGPTVTIDNGGLDYTSAPAITAIGGSGSGATFQATVQNGSVISINVTNPGSGYSPTDAVILEFTGGGSAYFTAVGSAVMSGQTLSGVTLTGTGFGYTSGSTTVQVLGGGGVGATCSISVSSGIVNAVTVTSGGEGYTSPPTIFIQDPNNPVAVAQASLMPQGVRGNAVETFTNRVWVAWFDQISFTAAGSATDFGAPDGGGQFQSTDSFLRLKFNGLKQSNGFLYLVGDSSINYVSGVNTSGSPPTTTFSNLNVDPQIGSPWANTIQVYSRSVVFANGFGVHALYGGAVQKVSAQLDGIYTTVPPANFGGIVPSAAVAVIFGIHVYMLLMPIIDTITQKQRNALLMWDGQRWWTASQQSTLKQIATQEIDSILTAWGTDGLNLFPLFQTATSSLTKTVQSKFWWNPSFIATKHVLRAYSLVQGVQPPSAISLQISVDSELQSQIVNAAELFAVEWVNNAQAVCPWINNAAQFVSWLTTSPAFISGGGVDVAGALTGFTITSPSPDFTLVAISGVLQSPYTWNI